ncbi:MAG: hypothetical protein ACO3A4_11165 [Silvanigrellaceae bacterium]
MWRLVVTQADDALGFAYCRPKRASVFLSEDCSARLDLKKNSNWRDQLTSDDFLFAVLSALQEKLPFRDFNQLGENYARPEPRIKSKLLESPPALSRGEVEIDPSNGQIRVRLISKFRDSVPEGALWFVPAEPMQGRFAAMETLLQESGLEKAEFTVPEAGIKTKNSSAPEARIAATPAPVASPVPPLPPVPTIAPPQAKAPPNAKPVAKQPLKSSELPPTPTAAKSSFRSKDRGLGAGKKTSIFATDVSKPPDDSEVVTLKGAETDGTSSDDRESFLSELWSVLWPGLWHVELDASGLPVPESDRARLPAVQSYSISAWHPIWSTISVGMGVRHRRDFENVSLKITLPGSSLFQLAQGTRKSSLVHGSLIQDFMFGESMIRIEALAGLNLLSASWNYDKKASTFEIWSPSERGTYLEPALSWMPSKNIDGFFGRAHYGLFKFPGARGSQWGIESGWQWSFDDELMHWGPVRISNLLSNFGFQQGNLKKLQISSTGDGSDTISLNSFWLGLRLRIDETY